MEIGPIIRRNLVQTFGSLFRTQRSKAIFYHDIHLDTKYTNISTPIQLFKKHIEIIRNCDYEIVSKIKKPHGQIEISFDDGFKGIYNNINLIKELNIPIQLFIITSYLNKKDYISESQLLDLNLLSQITVSSHSHQHKILNKISEKEIITELKTSKDFLESLLCKKVNSFCFPKGKFNDKVIKVAKQIGYNNLYTCIPGFYFDEILSGVKKRSLVQFAGKAEFKGILKGGDHFLARWYKQKHYNQ